MVPSKIVLLLLFGGCYWTCEGIPLITLPSVCVHSNQCTQVNSALKVCYDHKVYADWTNCLGCMNTNAGTSDTNILIDLGTAAIEESDLEHGDVYIDVDDTNSPPTLQRIDKDTVSINDNNRGSPSNDPPVLQRFDEDTVSDNDNNRGSQSNDPPVLHRFDTFDYELIEIVSASSSDFIINEPRADFIINEPWARQDMADDANENDELMSISSLDSDSGFGDSDSIISLISEFSSTTAELWYNKERHFGYIVAPEHVSPPIIVNESWRHARSLAVSDWVEELDEFVYACAYGREDDDGFTFGHTSREYDDVRECSSDTSIPRDRKRKRDDPFDVMKSTSDIDCSYKKRKLLES